VNPYGTVTGTITPGVGNNYFPWLAMSQSAANLVYQGATISPGPFAAQVANIAGQYPDLSILRF